MIPAPLLLLWKVPLVRYALAGLLAAAIAIGGFYFIKGLGAKDERAKQQERINDAAKDRRKIEDDVRELPDADLDRWLRKPSE
jgi:hypothetical protein